MVLLSDADDVTALAVCTCVAGTGAGGGSDWGELNPAFWHSWNRRRYSGFVSIINLKWSRAYRITQ
jgi:hypothetical protein